MRKTALILFLVFVSSMASLSQFYTAVSQDNNEDINPRTDKRFGIAIKAGGAWGILGGIAVDAFIVPEINVELNYLPVPILSSIQYYGGGINFHPWGRRNNWQFSPYVGVFFGHAEGKAFLTGEHEEFDALNVPLGIQYTGKNRRFGFALEIGAAYTREYARYAPRGYREEVYPTPSLKFRWGF